MYTDTSINTYVKFLFLSLKFKYCIKNLLFYGMNALPECNVKQMKKQCERF